MQTIDFNETMEKLQKTCVLMMHC